MPEGSESTLVSSHEPCDDCGSSDALATYSDNHTHCFSCGVHRVHHMGGEGESMADVVKSALATSWVSSQPTALAKRKLHEDTCSKWGYGVGEDNGELVQIANYYDDHGAIVAQKIRTAGKKFYLRGDAKQMRLYGQWLWRPGGRTITLVEGELDALSMSQLLDNRWPVVSLPQGAQGGAKAVKDQLEWLETFGRVVIMTDQDEPGRACAQAIAELLSPGKACIATLPLKDVSECLVAGRGEEVVSAFWEAKPHTPDGVLAMADIISLIEEQVSVPLVSYWHSGVEAMLKGFRRPSIVTLAAGSGVGKTEFAREIAYDLMCKGESVGYIPLEETPERTALGLASLHVSRPVYDLDSPLSEEGVMDALKWVGERCTIIDTSRSTGVDWILSKVRYLAVSYGYRYVVLDHLSHLVAEISEGDERRLIDNLMTKLKELVMELRIGLLLISHLRGTSGDSRSHEEGAKTRLVQLRGSRAIGQLSWCAIGLERDQQCGDPTFTTVRVLKNRPTSKTGIAGYYRFNYETGRLEECEAGASGFEDETSETNTDF